MQIEQVLLYKVFYSLYSSGAKITKPKNRPKKRTNR